MSTKDYGCFFCAGKSINEFGNCDKCGQSIDIKANLLDTKIDDYKLTTYLGRGFYGWTFLAKDRLQNFAIKVIPAHRFQESALTNGADEANALTECSHHRNLARFIRQVDAVLNVKDHQIKAVGLVFDYIPNAITLGAFLSNAPSELSRTDVKDILTGIASGLQRMLRENLWHRDLHDDNIMIRIIDPDENLSERYEPKLIDFGSTKKIHPGTPESADQSDYFYFAKHIYALTAVFEKVNWGKLKSSDRVFANSLKTLAHRIADKDVSRRNLSPGEVKNEIERALKECANGNDFPTFVEMLDKSRQTFSKPLDNQNALSLYPQDIAALFRDSLGWEPRISRSEAVLVTGPRGCGKTMLFRYLSVASFAWPGKHEESTVQVAARLASMSHIGFLVSGVKLRTPFFRAPYKKLQEEHPSQAEDFCREYFNLSFAFEVARTLVWLIAENLIGLSSDEQVMLANVLSSLLKVKTNTEVDSLSLVTELLDRRFMELSSAPTAQDYKATDYCRDDVLHNIAQALRRTDWGSKREVWFLLDDYSVTVLPEFAQKAYNPVLFRLSSEARIKISSEGDGPELSDSLGRLYREGREISRLNLGEVYFENSEEECRRFFEEILKARYDAAEKGNLEAFKASLGEHLNEDNFGDYLRSKKRTGDARFYGFGIICQLCSGDVSFIIELLHELSNVQPKGNPLRVSEAKQDQVIKSFSHRQLGALRSVSVHGTQLHDFATNVGKRIRYELTTSTGKRPDERLRFEISGAWSFSSEYAQKLHDALLRHSVLIPFGAGKDRDGVPCRRLYFRRLFAPCFPFSTNRRGTLAMTMQLYESWLLNPSQISYKRKKPTQTNEGDLLDV